MQAPLFLHEPTSTPTPKDLRDEILKSPGFGSNFTDHMLVMEYSSDTGWQTGVIQKRQPFKIDPASGVLHTGQEIFEGMKAYRTEEGGAAIFRPKENARRFNMSANRMAMPEIPEDVFIAGIEEFVRIERNWIPEIGDGTLYLRPFMFASEAFIGVRPSKNYTFSIIASPVGGYFSNDANALKLWICKEYSRAAPGGTGAAKCGGNYASSLVASAQAARKSCDQVLFLDAKERRWIEELGGMNIFFVFDDGSIITPPLTGTILPGITRDSILKLADRMGRNVVETPYSLEQLEADAQSGRLSEAFACGTAAVITSIGRLIGEEMDIVVGDGGAGAVASELREILIGIQHGARKDEYGWRHPVL